MTDIEHKRIKLLKRLACYCKYLAFCPDLFCQFNGYPGSAFDVALEPQCPGRKVILKLVFVEFFSQIEVHTSTIHLLDLVGAEMSADVKVKKRSHKDKVCLVR